MRMVEDLLDLASIERGLWRINKAPCAMDKVLTNEVEKAKLFAQAQGIAVTFAVPEKDVPVIEADAHRMHQVVWNLLHNAVKYTLPGGMITIGLEVREMELEVSVTDTGEGIPKEALEKIFEKFCQAHPYQSKLGCGLGLGLALAKEIICAHGGDIWAQSPGPGKGSTFTFTLPRRTPLHKEVTR